MKILLAHVSDIHLRTAADRVISRIPKLKDAIVSAQPNADACFIALTGDIANTGSPDEYEVAKTALLDLRSALLLAGLPVVEFVVIPGNHDCNLTRQDETRLHVLDTLDKFLSKPINYSSSLFKSVIEVQKDFFRFEAELTNREQEPAATSLHYQRVFTVAGQPIVFHCFNTAWLSRKNEVQTELYIPEETLSGSTPKDAAFSVAMFHHPYNWLNNENARALKAFVEANVEVVLTGHEHAVGGGRRDVFTGAQLDYIEAAALQEHDDVRASGFQLLRLDFEAEAQDVTLFSWDGERYHQKAERLFTLRRNPERPDETFSLSPAFASEVRSVGAGFSHPNCSPPRCQLRLRDLFVYPDLRHRELKKVLAGQQDEMPNIPGEMICDFVEKNGKVIIYGADDSGKTALSKILYEDLRARGYVPILLTEQHLKRCTTYDGLLSVIREAAKEQFKSSPATEAFVQLDRAKRVIIIDDFHKARLPKAKQGQAVSQMLAFSPNVLIFASDLFRLEELTSAQTGSAFAAFAHCDIKEMGKFHRNRLIEKWLYLGNENVTEPEELLRQVAHTDKIIATLMGKNTLPHYPVTILTLLQLSAASQSANTANGSYGYLYEVLIKGALAQVAKNPTDVDLAVTYISGIAYSMFTNNVTALNDAQLRQAHQLYCDRYDMNRDYIKMIADLRNAEIVVERDGLYHFKYPYIFYYAVAKYMQENSKDMRPALNDIADHIYNDTNANILIFYVYLTKDPELIRRLVENARRIYDEHKQCDLEGDVEFVNSMYTQPPPPLQLSCDDIRANRDAYYRRQDEADAEVERTRAHEQVEAENHAYKRELNDAIKVNIAFKTVQILGQVLRNFPGSLDGALKQEITAECYALGMRTLKALLAMAENNLDAFRKHIAEMIAERTAYSDSEVADRTERAIIWLMEAAGYGCVKRVSYAVGHPDLLNTYEKVLAARDGDLSGEIIDAAVKLDHFDRVPEQELRRLRSRVKKNRFGYTIAREIVRNFLYLYSSPWPTMQQLGSTWEIKVAKPKYLISRAKIS